MRRTARAPHARRRPRAPAAGATFCAKPWSEVASKYSASYCFSSAYIASLFDAYAVPADAAADAAPVFARKIRGFTAGWTLGAQLFFIEEAACGFGMDAGPALSLAAEPPPRCAAPPDAALSLGLGVVFALVGGLLLGLLSARLLQGRADGCLSPEEKQGLAAATVSSTAELNLATHLR